MGEQYFTKIKKGDKIHNYSVEKFIGSGEQGEVYKVKDLSSGGFGALKIYYPYDANKEYRKKEVNKICTALKRLAFINELPKYYKDGIKTFYYSYESSNKQCYYMVMEYFEGTSLEKLVKKENHKFSELEALKIAKDLILIYKKANEKNISLLDLHWDNVLFDKKENIKIIDFSLPGKFDSRQIKHNIGSTWHLLGCLIVGRKKESADFSNENLSKSLKESIPELTGHNDDWTQNEYQTADEMLEKLDSLMKNVKKDNF